MLSLKTIIHFVTHIRLDTWICDQHIYESMRRTQQFFQYIYIGNSTHSPVCQCL